MGTYLLINMVIGLVMMVSKYIVYLLFMALIINSYSIRVYNNGRPST